MSLQIYKKYNYQRANAELAICTARVEWHRVGPRALLHALCHYALWAKIILAEFNLAVSVEIAKPPNLIPRQIFRLYGTHCVHTSFLSSCDHTSQASPIAQELLLADKGGTATNTVLP